MFKRILLFVVLIYTTVSVGAELLSSHRSNIAEISRVDFLYEVVDVLPETDQNIVFGLLHTDELLYDKFAQFQGRSEVSVSSSRVIKKWLGLINQRIKAAHVSRVFNDEMFFKFTISSTDESFVVGLRLEKLTVRSVSQLFAFVTIYGIEKEEPRYLLNFLQSCFLEKTTMQKHWGKFLLVGAGLTLGVYSKRYQLKGKIDRAMRRIEDEYPVFYRKMHDRRARLQRFLRPNGESLKPIASEGEQMALTQEAMDGELYDQVFHLFNVNLRDTIAHHPFACGNFLIRLSNIFAPYGGLKVLKKNFE